MEVDKINLWCYIEGKGDYFSVSIPITQFIGDLKTNIHTQYLNSLAGYDAGDLILTKVRYIIIPLSTSI